MQRKCIICVDDEKIVLDSLQAQLNRHFGNQFNYELAESGEEALEILDELHSSNYSIIVIISDWLMPNMKGDEFLLKAHAKFPRVHKLMLTGHADYHAIGYLTSEIKDFRVIYKPWQESQLVEAISVGLEYHN